MIEWVDKNVAVGNWMDARDVEQLREEDIDFVIDARAFFDDSRGRGHRTPDLDQIIKEVSFMLTLASAGARILVRCHHGRDRGPFVAMIYLSQKKKISYDQAYHEVKKKRPRTELHWDWVEQLEAHTPGPT